MGLGKDLDLYVTSEGRRIDWGDSGKVQDVWTIEVGFRMKGGGIKRKTKIGNHWESLASGGESEGSEETERSRRDGMEEDMAEVLEDALNKAKVEGWLVYEMVETLAVLGQREREEMLRWYEGMMPKEISKGKRDVGLLQLRWMVEEDRGESRDVERGGYEGWNEEESVQGREEPEWEIGLWEACGENVPRGLSRRPGVLWLDNEAGEAVGPEIETIQVFP